MAFPTVDISGHYAFFHNGETVTLTRVRAGTSADTTIHNATDAPVSYSQAMALGAGFVGDKQRSFSLNATEVGSSGIEVDDVLTDADNAKWRIKSAVKKTLGTRWVVVGQKNKG